MQFWDNRLKNHGSLSATISGTDHPGWIWCHTLAVSSLRKKDSIRNLQVKPMVVAGMTYRLCWKTISAQQRGSEELYDILKAKLPQHTVWLGFVIGLTTKLRLIEILLVKYCHRFVVLFKSTTVLQQPQRVSSLGFCAYGNLAGQSSCWC